MTHDPFTVPKATHVLVDAAAREEVVVAVTVWDVELVRWAGGEVLEVTVVDATGRITLVFFGRDSIGGLQPGRQMVVAGRVGRHRGERVLMNPRVWLQPTRLNALLAREDDFLATP